MWLWWAPLAVAGLHMTEEFVWPGGLQVVLPTAACALFVASMPFLARSTAVNNGVSG